MGLRRREPTHPLLMPYGALLSFATATHLWLPSDTPSQAFHLAGKRREWKGSGYPQQRPCLFGVEFPLSGPRDRICLHDSPPV